MWFKVLAERQDYFGFFSPKEKHNKQALAAAFLSLFTSSSRRIPQADR